MSIFIKVLFGEKGKACGFHLLNIDLIKYVEYVEVNEAIPKTAVVEQVPYMTVHYGEGRQTFIFNEEQAKVLLNGMEVI